MTVTGQTGIVSGSLVEAWIRPEATADHSADEHVVESPWLKVVAADIVAGTGFTIRAIYENPNDEPLSFPGAERKCSPSTTAGQNTSAGPTVVPSVGGKSLKAYGQWTVAWVWN